MTTVDKSIQGKMNQDKKKIKKIVRLKSIRNAPSFLELLFQMPHPLQVADQTPSNQAETMNEERKKKKKTHTHAHTLN